MSRTLEQRIEELEREAERAKERQAEMRAELDRMKQDMAARPGRVRKFSADLTKEVAEAALRILRQG